MENYDREFSWSIEELGKEEMELLVMEKEMRELFKVVKENNKIMKDCEEKTVTMYAAVDKEIKRIRFNMNIPRRKNHRVNKNRNNPNRKIRKVSKRVYPVRKITSSPKRPTPKVTRPKKIIIRKPARKRMGSPIPRRSSKRLTGRRITTPNVTRNVSLMKVTPKLRKRNYVITPIRSSRDRIRYEHLNFTSENISVGSRPSKQKKVVAEGKPEEPVFISYKKMSEVGNVDLTGFRTSPQFIWSVPVFDVRRKKYFRSGILVVFNLRFVMKVVSRGVRGKRHISFYLEYLPKDEKFEDVSLEISICLLNATRGSFSLGYNSLYKYSKKNVSFGWSFFGLKGKILRKGNGFVYDDNTIAFDLRIRELIVGNKPLVMSEN